MNYGWYEKPTKIDVKNFVGGESPAAVFDLGQYQITVHGFTPENTPDITYTRYNRYKSGDPRKTFPNMEVTEGVLRIPVEDIVGEMLSRLDPVDLAKTLWNDNGEVRAEFMNCMTDHYESGITDADRRAFLVGVKADIHDRRADSLQKAFSESEYNFSRSVFFWDQVQRANDQLARAEQMVRQALGQPVEPEPDQAAEVFTLPRLRDDNREPSQKLFGTNWVEARDHWRDKVAEIFPRPIAIEAAQS